MALTSRISEATLGQTWGQTPEILNVLGYRTPDWKTALADFVRQGPQL